MGESRGHGVAKRRGLFQTNMSRNNLSLGGATVQTVASPKRVVAGSACPARPAFECDVCGRAFATKIGVGVHKRRAHVVVANAEIEVTRAKARWPDEEKRLIAMLDADALEEGHPPVRINGILFQKHPGRTLESIKGRRRTAEHRNLVLEARAAIIGQGAAPHSEVVTDSAAASAPTARVTPTGEDRDRTAGDRAGHEGSLRVVPSAAQKAVDLLSTVSGHGVQTLLTAAKLLANQSVDPCDAIAAWYRNYGKSPSGPLVRPGAATSRKRKSWAPDRVMSKRGTGGTSANADVSSRLSRKALNAALYRRNVFEWRSKPKRVVDRILTGIDTGELTPEYRKMLDYWVPVIEAEDVEASTQDPAPAPSTATEGSRSFDILTAISPEEVALCLPSAKTAAGPDGFRARLWRRLPMELLAGVFNLFIAAGRLPATLVASRTIFVPKKGDPECPGNYRPISIASVAVRHFHRILAQRLEKLSLVDVRQRAFRKADGAAENIFLLDSLLRDARSSCRGLCLASLDLSKAFDTVSHYSITTAMRKAGLAQNFVDYIRGTYAQSGTFIQVAGQCSSKNR